MSDKANTDQELLSFIREARKFLALVESPGWIASEELTDDEHLTEMKAIMSKSREATELPDKTVMNSVRNMDNGLILAITGNTPAASERARFLTGMMSALPRLLEGIEASLVNEPLMQARIQELLESNNEKLFENRDQRETIRKLNAQITWLLDRIPGVQAS